LLIIETTDHAANQAMRGADGQQPGMFSCVSVEAGVPANRPIRKLPLVGPDAVRG